MATSGNALAVVALVLALMAALPQSSGELFSATLSGGVYNVAPGRAANAVALFDYKNEINATGWATYRFHSSRKFSNLEQFYAIGYLEGAVTAPLIWNMFQLQANNAWGFDPNGPVPPAVYNWLASNIRYVQMESEANAATSSFWAAAGLFMAQLSGMTDAYAASAMAKEAPMDMVQIYMLFAAGDLEDLMGLLGAGRERFAGLDCSGFVKLMPDGDIQFGHTTWRPFGLMLRVLRFYDLELHATPMGSPLSGRLAFSSSPGFASSKDDFYVVVSAELAVFETTISIYNSTIHDGLTPASVLSWQRMMVANLLANSGPDWGLLASFNSSGTYSNEYLVLDMKLKLPMVGTLTLTDMLPGYSQTVDVTQLLMEQGYVASYNIPYLPEAFDLAGFPAMVAKYGAGYTFAGCPRALIFAKQNASVVDGATMGRIMQYNEYQTDPLSGGNPANAIASRYDLEPTKAAAFGGVDAKTVSVKDFKANRMWAISGPTHVTQVPFAFTGQWASMFSAGLPKVWDFDWVHATLYEKI